MSFVIQNQIKNNSTDIKNYIDDLYKWEDDVSTQKPKKRPNPKNDEDLPPIRGKVQQDLKDLPPVRGKDQKQNQNESEASKNSRLKRDGNTVSDYYKAWDKFNPDEELKKLDSNENEEYRPPTISKPVELDPRKQPPLAPANTKIVVKGGRNPNSEYDALKDKANLLFRTHEYAKALEIYSEIIEKLKIAGSQGVFFSTLLSNRAMTYIKLQDFVRAEADCELAISKTPDFGKAFIRRGICRKKMGKIKAALIDFRKGLELEGENIEVAGEIKALEEVLKTRRAKAAKSLVMPFQSEGRKMKRIEVMDVGIVTVENEKKEQDVLGTLSFTVEREEGKKKNKSEVDDDNKENEKRRNEKEENVEKTESKEPKIEESSDIGKSERKDDKELSFEYVKLKEIDRMTKGKSNKASGDFEEVQRKKVSFGGEIDILIGQLKKLIFPQKSQPKKSIFKQKQKKTLENPEAQKKIGLENVISQGKTQIIEEILKEAKTQAEKNSMVLNSAQFFAKWKNLHQDKKSAFCFLQVLIKQSNKNIIIFKKEHRT